MYLSIFLQPSFPPYGSVGYLDQLRNRTVTWEFAIVKGDIGIECSMDLNYFSKEPSSVEYLNVYRPRASSVSPTSLMSF